LGAGGAARQGRGRADPDHHRAVRSGPLPRPDLKQWVPAGRDAAILCTAMLVSSFGTGMFLAGSAIFFTKTVGLSESELGFGLGIAAAIGFAASLPIGSLADWAGAKRMLVILVLWRGGCFAALAFAGDLAGLILAASAQAAAQQSTSPVT